MSWTIARGKAVWVRLQVIAYLALAFCLIRLVRFGRWRGWLGARITTDMPRRAAAVPDDQMYRARICGRIVARMADRSPIELVCLPKSMALHWLLRMENIPSELNIGVETGEPADDARGLHAWVEVAGVEVPPANSNDKFQKILTLAFPQP